jgi:carbonic anhydrase
MAVVVVGHTECGGALACLGAAQAGNDCTIPTLPADAPLNRWLGPLTKLSCSLNDKKAAQKEALNSLVEANVKVQVENLCKSQTLIDAWNSKDPAKRNIWVHGWVYDLASGTLKDLNISHGPTNTNL